MNRRSFIKRIAIAAAGVAAGATLLSDQLTARREIRLTRYDINPAYLTAGYEAEFFFHPDAFKELNSAGFIRPVPSRFGINRFKLVLDPESEPALVSDQILAQEEEQDRAEDIQRQLDWEEAQEA